MLEKFNTLEPDKMRFTAEIDTESNGEESKTWKISIKARDAKPINHPFWGNVVHDFDGMNWHKAKVAVDWCHDDNQLLGYVNRSTADDTGLYLHGVLTPFQASDKASEVIHWLETGVPLEASIDFADEIELSFVDAGDTYTVNGNQLTAPEGGTVIVSKWWLRRIAICPSGADANTETSMQWTYEQTSIQPSIKVDDNTVSDTTDDDQNTVDVEDKSEAELIQDIIDSFSQSAVEDESVETEEKVCSECELKNQTIVDLRVQLANLNGKLHRQAEQFKEQLAKAINGDSEPVTLNGAGGNAEPKTWAEAVNRYGYAQAFKRFQDLYKKTIK